MSRLTPPKLAPWQSTVIHFTSELLPSFKRDNNGHCHCISFTTLTVWQSPFITIVSRGAPVTWWPAKQQKGLREFHLKWRRKQHSVIHSAHNTLTLNYTMHTVHIDMCMCWLLISTAMQIGFYQKRSDINNLSWLCVKAEAKIKIVNFTAAGKKRLSYHQRVR